MPVAASHMSLIWTPSDRGRRRPISRCRRWPPPSRPRRAGVVSLGLYVEPPGGW